MNDDDAMDMLRRYADGLVKRAQKAEASVAELEALYADLRDDWVYLHKRYDSPEEAERREKQRKEAP